MITNFAVSGEPFRVFAAGVLLLIGVSATSVQAGYLTPEETTAVEELSTYLNSFKTLRAEFTQISPQGRVFRGILFLSKPGRLRLEYAPPNPFLVISAGTWVVIENRKQKTTDQYPLAATLLKLLLAEEINLLQETRVRSVEASGGVSTISVEDRNRAIPGKLVLIFDANRKQLSQWIVEIDKGKRMTISLANLKTGVDQDGNLFEANIPKENESR